MHAHYRSKTLAAWLALGLGALGAHRLYLYGLRDRGLWLYLPPTLIGGVGALRLRALGPEDALGSLLVPLLGLMLALAMLQAILLALTPDERWDARHNPGHAVTPTGWGAVLAAIVALLLGGTVLMATLAFSGQRFFEWQLEALSAATATSG